MRKVYNLIMKWKFDGDRGVEVETFETKQAALESYRKLVEREKVESWIGDYPEELEMEERDGYFSAYYEEWQAETDIYIEEKEVKG